MATQGRGTPSISVVVPTFRRPHLLQALLDGLAAQDVAGGFEVIVVDDASGDATQAVLERAAREAPYELTAVHLERNGGPARARNVGWRRARAPLVAFTDDDCVPRPDWLAQLQEAARHYDAVQGNTVVDADALAQAGPFSRWINVGLSPFYETCNIAYPTALLDELDGFDETFTFAAGEDTDLAHRALRRGATIGPARDAVVVHTVHPSSLRAGLRSSRRLDGLVQAVERYPGSLRQYFHGRLFWFPAHGPAVLAVLGIVAVVVGIVARSGWVAAAGLVLGVPYARHRLLVAPLTTRSRWERVLWVPAGLLVDLAELGVVTRARWRYRGTARDISPER